MSALIKFEKEPREISQALPVRKSAVTTPESLKRNEAIPAASRAFRLCASQGRFASISRHSAPNHFPEINTTAATALAASRKAGEISRRKFIAIFRRTIAAG